jgi:hypothetical protein
MIIVLRVLSLFNAGLGITRFYSSYKEKTYEAGRSLRSTASAIESASSLKKSYFSCGIPAFPC